MSTDFPFTSFADIDRYLQALPGPDAAATAAAAARNAVLTKPAGALGRLEELAIWLAGWQGTDRPQVGRVEVLVFAGNHGVAAAGVSAFPPEVTAQMVANFDAGGAAINQLAGVLGAGLRVTPLDLDRPTGNIAEGPAMDEEAFLDAVAAGWRAVTPAAQLVVPGEMGIGNTTIAAALACHTYGGSAEDWVGAGTGVDAEGKARKAVVISAACARHAGLTGAEALRCLGGRELAAMAGAVLAARHHRIPVVLDGFIATAALAPLAAAAPQLLEHCVAGHVSQEPGHGRLLEAMGLQPLLDLDLRLGEGSGAAVAALIVKAAAACHSGMASFDEAGVSDG